MTTSTITWGRSGIDGHVHAWTDERCGGDAVAVCEHACPPQHVNCSGEGLRCSTCLEATVRPP